jgi:hypothetical protein
VTVHLKREHKSVVSGRGGIKELDSELLVTRAHDIIKAKEALEQERVRFGGMEEPGKFMLGIFIGNYPSTKHVRVDIEGLRDGLSCIRVKTDGRHRIALCNWSARRTLLKSPLHSRLCSETDLLRLSETATSSTVGSTLASVPSAASSACACSSWI